LINLIKEIIAFRRNYLSKRDYRKGFSDGMAEFYIDGRNLDRMYAECEGAKHQNQCVDYFFGMQNACKIISESKFEKP